jgi:hypothetical protein
MLESTLLRALALSNRLAPFALDSAQLLINRWRVREISGPNGGEIPMPVSANPFVVHIERPSEPGQKPTEFKVRPYEKNGGNGD